MKVDWCHTEGQRGRTTYPKWTEAIKATGRPMVLSICEWSRDKPWEWGGTVGYMWRTTGDIADTWTSVLSIADRNAELHPHAGPDHWNDPDMLEVGNGGMTDDEYRAHLSLWAVMAAPLMAGNDLRSMTDETRAILAAPEVIAVDQDALGLQGRRVSRAGETEVWTRALADGGYAVLLLNRGESSARIAAAFSEVARAAKFALVRDLWERVDLGIRADAVDATVGPHAAALLKVSPR